jgi:rRNA-processing protein EBP2
MVKIKPSAKISSSKHVPKMKRKVPIQPVSEGESSTLEGDEAGVDDEGMQRLMNALGEDELDKYSEAHLAVGEDEGEDESASGSDEGDSEDGEDNEDEDEDEEAMPFEGGEEIEPSDEGSERDDDEDDQLSDEDEVATDELRDQNNAVSIPGLHYVQR